ncbi:Thermophilic glucose-6-phosphate isomerase and related metalloenzymes [Cedecea neteri]|nr:Thermophilic glucose-6-phosphate isomerase and related metalloenzymes [Cedecea neteri]
MQNFYQGIENAVYDPVAGIRIARLQNGSEMNAFGTRMDKGAKVSSHVHTQGDEWYSILDGEGVIYLADWVGEVVQNRRHFPVRKGDVFCLQANTAHQIYAHTQLDLIFYCPDTHLGTDRTVLDDLLVQP